MKQLKKLIFDKIVLEKDLAKCLWHGQRSKGHQAESYIESDDEIIINKIEKASVPIPRKIWIYWDSPNIPLLVQATVKRLRDLNPDHELEILNQHTVRSLVNSKLLDRVDMIPAHKSDIVRIELLRKYGGIWIDATCIFSENLDWIHTARDTLSSDFIGYYRETATTDFSSPILENWFLCSEPNNQFLGEWLDDLYRAHSEGIGKYYDNLKHRQDFSSFQQKINRPDYLVAYVASQVAARRLDNVNMFLRRAEASPYYYQDSVQWNRERVAQILCLLKSPENSMPVIKLTHSNRYLLPSLIKRRFFLQDSIIGNFIAPVM